MDCNESAKNIERLLQNLDGAVPAKSLELATEIKCLFELIKSEAGERWVCRIKRNKMETYNAELDAWSTIGGRFKSIEPDIIAALKCYLVDENTAAIFHMMRVAEIGLRAIAKERRIKLPKGHHIDWADWNDLLQELHKKVELLANKKRGPARDAALAFYRGAMGHFEAFKDEYRNNVMHARKQYDEIKALSVLRHVREFMLILASKMDDDGKAIKWGIR